MSACIGLARRRTQLRREHPSNEPRLSAPSRGSFRIRLCQSAQRDSMFAELAALPCSSMRVVEHHGLRKVENSGQPTPAFHLRLFIVGASPPPRLTPPGSSPSPSCCAPLKPRGRHAPSYGRPWSSSGNFQRSDAFCLSVRLSTGLSPSTPECWIAETGLTGYLCQDPEVWKAHAACDFLKNTGPFGFPMFINTGDWDEATCQTIDPA